MYEHIFNDHHLKPIHYGAVYNNAMPHIWPSVIIIFGFGLFVFLKITAFPKLIDTFRSSYSIQATKQLEREEFNPFNLVSFSLSLLFLLMLSFFLFKINSEYGHILKQSNSFTQYIFFFTCASLFLPIKFGLKKAIGFISNTKQLTNEIVYNNLVINQSLGLVLLPIMTVIEFGKMNGIYILIATSILFMTSLFIKLYRGVMFSLFENHIGLLQVFIYLCALEILPFLVFIKFIITTF